MKYDFRSWNEDGFVVYAVDESTIMGGEAKKLHEVNNIGEVVERDLPLWKSVKNVSLINLFK